ncbi:MAG TPA: OmpA family protein [Caulobacteraceae bacterium]|jgi:outer membrane protein OmpA-like peptidoglycan-associated protein/uncharacterized protein YidB (DUF937 family)
MATTSIDNLISESGSKFGIGAAAGPLMRELLQVMTGGPGGLGAFLDRLRSAGLGAEVSSFIGGKSEVPLAPNTVDSVMGETTVVGIARRVGLAPAAAAAALGFAIPKMIGLLTPGGKLPTALPSDIQRFVGQGEQVSPMAMAGVRETEQVPPVAMATVPQSRNNWVWWLLGLAVLALIIWLLLARRPAPVHTVAAPPVPVPAAAPVAPPAPVKAVVENLNHELNNTVLNFPTASAVLPTESAPVLQQAADQIKTLPAGTVIMIGGHTDNVGNSAANLTLSQQRADAVRAALVQDGVNPSMLQARGFGDTRPLESNDTASGRLHNRRTEFTFAGNGANAPANGAAVTSSNGAGSATTTTTTTPSP